MFSLDRVDSHALTVPSDDDFVFLLTDKEYQQLDEALQEASFDGQLRLVVRQLCANKKKFADVSEIAVPQQGVASPAKRDVLQSNQQLRQVGLMHSLLSAIYRNDLADVVTICSYITSELAESMVGRLEETMLAMLDSRATGNLSKMRIPTALVTV